MLNSNTTDLHDNLINDKYIQHGDLYAYQLQKQSLKYLKLICYLFFKRAFDIIFSLAALILLSPLFLFIAVLIKIDSKGPAFFIQERVNHHCDKFKMYKFRSMCSDAEQKKFSLEYFNEMDGPVFKMQNDPRITRVGKIIRKLSIDELPQLLNVLKGDMSIVGPRPALPREVEKYNKYQMQRLLVKQGLTCYWQVYGRNNIPFDEWVKLDIKYIHERGILTDLIIILKTIPAVLSCRGAN